MGLPGPKVKKARIWRTQYAGKIWLWASSLVWLELNTSSKSALTWTLKHAFFSSSKIKRTEKSDCPLFVESDSAIKTAFTFINPLLHALRRLSSDQGTILWETRLDFYCLYIICALFWSIFYTTLGPFALIPLIFSHFPSVSSKFWTYFKSFVILLCFSDTFFGLLWPFWDLLTIFLPFSLF